MHRVELSLTSFKLRLSIYFLFGAVVRCRGSIKVSLHQPTSFRKENESRDISVLEFFLYFFVYLIFLIFIEIQCSPFSNFAKESFVYLIFT